MEDIKTLQKQVENLQKQFEKVDAYHEAKAKQKEKELEILKSYQRGEHRNDYPEDIEKREEREVRDKYLYKPLEDVIEDDDLDICGYIYTGKTPEDVIEYVEDHEREIIDNNSEIIYYSEAMDYLHEHDQTLTYALELAYNSGYDLKNLNSCILASLLKQDDENLYGKFNEDLEALKEKAEEMREERDRIEEDTGKKMDDIIEEEAKKRAQEKIEALWKPEELKEYKEQRKRYEKAVDESQEARRERAKARKEMRAKEKELEELEKALQPNQAPDEEQQ